MPPENPYDLSFEAISDLDHIWWFGANKWSPAQANKYQHLLHSHLIQLAEGIAHKKIFNPDDEIWVSNFGSHQIYFKLHKARPIVARILHGSQLPENHL